MSQNPPNPEAENENPFQDEADLEALNDEFESEYEDDDLEDNYTEPRFTISRGSSSDPTFGYLIALALSVGLMALPGEERDLRFTLLWMVIAGFGVLAWLFSSRMPHIEQESPENVSWGVVFGLIIAVPLLAVGGNTLVTTVNLLFTGMSWGTLLAYLVFAMPLAETLFFRGLLQEDYPFWVVGLMSSLWSGVFFFPLLDIPAYPAVIALLALALLMMNMTYSYVRRRNGLAAAWICQIVVNLVLIFIPYISL
ncbi:MAG: hypothetical protein K8L99_17110 [Anaerolineae bacterium]|nr:hypothetical protein [Anaerolineae bacterium]